MIVAVPPRRSKEDGVGNYLSELIDFAVSVNLDTLPASVLHEAHRTLVDTVGVILGGMSDPTVRRFADEMAQESTRPCCRLLGTPWSADPMWAALVHGTAGVWYDFDAGNRFAEGHPAIHVVPAGMAVAVREGATGRRFLEAVIAGYEVGARVGLGTTLREGMHPHGTWAVPGAAVTASLLAGFDRAAVQETLNASTSLTLATSWQTAYEGATVRNVYAGHGAAMGVFAADAVAAGLTGELDGVSTVFGSLSGTAFNSTLAVEGIGERWEIERGYLKTHASARYLHTALDALIALTGEHGFEPGDITSIRVRTFARAASMADPHPQNPLAAKFSLPHTLAAWLVLGDTGIDAFEHSALKNQVIRSLANRIKVSEDPEMSARTPEVRPANVALTLVDGRTFEATLEVPTGDDAPVPDGAVDTKFAKLARRVLDDAETDRVRSALWQIEDIVDLDSLW